MRYIELQHQKSAQTPKRTSSVHFVTQPFPDVTVALVILYNARPILVAEAEAILATQPTVVFPLSDEHVTIRPSLHPSPASPTANEISRVKLAVFKQLDTVSVRDVASLARAVDEGAAEGALELSLMLLPVIDETRRRR